MDRARALTEKNLKNARELFESYLQQVFGQSGEGWNTSKLKSITSKIGSGATPKGGKAAYKVEGISLIRSMNVYDRRFLEKDLAFIDDDQAEKLSNVIVEKNDVLLNITGASVARCALAPEEFLPARVNQHVSIIRVNQEELLPAFLNYALTSKFYKDQLLGIGESGSTRQAITKKQIEEFEVSYPLSLDQQTRFIQQLELLESHVKEVQCIYEKKLHSLDELKKSILQMAFIGELTKDSKEAAA
ncbi:restriction endonuclease subunit S [Parahaliea maris]|uniref:Restriction endonuclease subunit S n=1 Tax=Parahaliea maris TaxID=2716870 RepID=A0A5C8ZKX1_9GAMM|nr:restriction endonuclease subunit S [Parahaliea maris]